MTAPAPVTYANAWLIEASPARLESAALAWRRFAAVAERIVGDIDAPTQSVYDGGWAGQTADEFDRHRRRLTADLRATGELAHRQADELVRSAVALRTGQARLDDALARLTDRIRAEWSPDGSYVTFFPQDQAQVQLLVQGAADARSLRERIDADLLSAEIELHRLRAEWELIAQGWEATANGATPYALPPEATGTSVLRAGNTTIINTGPGDDTVVVGLDRSTGHQIIEVNGVPYRFAPGVSVVVRTGEGRDAITVTSTATLRLTLLGGAGADTIDGGDGNETILGHTGDDRIHAGSGDDRVAGGAGRDYIDGYRGHDRLAGGAGDDVVYGLSGADRISGGVGRDYLEGGTGADVIDGGDGADILSGGRDRDVLRGGSGQDHLYAGPGRDTVAGGTGNDTGYVDRPDAHGGVEQVVTVELRNLGQRIRIEGSDEFVERVQADLELLRSSPTGQQMLAAVDPDGGGGTLIIRETGAGNEAEWRVGGLPWHEDTYTVSYNPDALAAADQRPPIVGLAHELGHVYDYRYHTGAPGVYQGADNPNVDNRERAVVGLPVDLDEDGRPDGLWGSHPHQLTENALRREMGWPERTRY